MLKRTVRGIFQIIGGLGAGFTIVFVLIIWRLSMGPISLGFLAPHISKAMTEAMPGIEALFEDTILVWAGWERAIDIRIINLQFTAGDGVTVGFVPEVALALSTEALAKGTLAPSELELFGPTLTITRDAEGRFAFGFSGASMATNLDGGNVVAWVSGKPEVDSPIRYLRSLRVTGADLIVDDQIAGRAWAAPDTQFEMTRTSGGIEASASLSAALDGQVAEIVVSGTLDGERNRAHAGAAISGVNPSVLASISPDIAILNRFSMPLEGLVTVDATLDGMVETVGFDLSGAHGSVELPSPLEGSVGVRSVSIGGTYDAVVHRVEIDRLALSLVEGQRIALPAGLNHDYPVGDLAFVGAYQSGEDRLTVDTLDVQLGAYKLSAVGLIDGLTERPVVSMEIAVPRLAVEDFAAYWPATFGEDAYDWTISNISAGDVYDFRVAIEGGVNDTGGFDFGSVDGFFRYRNVELTYLSSLPPVIRGMGSAQFDRDRLDFAVEQAQSFGMAVDSASVSLVGISGPSEQAHIEVSLSGPFRNAMQLIDMEPMGFAKELNIRPDDVSGEADVELAFDFPLTLGLAWEDVASSVLANVSGVNIPDGLFGLDVGGADIEIVVDNDGMDIIGDLKLEGYATNINWRQEFDPTSKVRNTYTLNAWINSVESLADLGVDTRPFASDMVRGDMPLWVNVVERRDGESVLSARAGLTGVEIDLPALEWRKTSGQAGEANVELRLRGGSIIAIPSFRVDAPDMSVRGKAFYAGEKLELSRVELEKVVVGRTDLRGLLIPRGNGVWDADFNGASLDLAGLWDQAFEGDLLDSGQSLLPNLSLSAQFDRVWLSDTEHIDDITSAFVREDAAWRTIYITAILEQKEALEIKLAPSSDSSPARLLTMWSRDAGAVLRFLRINDNMIGGEFNLVGRFEDTRPGGPLTGLMEMTKFRIVNAPTLAKVVSVMSLTGILEALSGEGLAFERMEVPFRFHEGVLEMKQAQANGPSLGFTANGKIYTHADVVDIEGTVVPAYLLNSMLGKIPLIGNVFSGGEAGGGVFAARYAMTGARDDPEVTVNPLSALTPGFLRNLFGIFDGSETSPSGATPKKTRRDTN